MLVGGLRTLIPIYECLGADIDAYRAQLKSEVRMRASHALLVQGQPGVGARVQPQ